MSALAWIFGLGALAVTFPVLFHLIRRTPKGQTQFSSLMFLEPSPPTLTRRSRLDNLLLLALRALAIGLIAFAFTRPFFRSSEAYTGLDAANRRVAILLDTSASMKRNGAWESARNHVEAVLSDLEPGDDVALFGFSDDIQVLANFAEESTQTQAQQVQLIRDRLSEVEPDWGRSDLGTAIVSVADGLDVWRDSVKEESAASVAKLQLVVISDFQKSSRLDALYSYQWSEHVYCQTMQVKTEAEANATVQLLNPAEDDEAGAFRVRVAHFGESDEAEFPVAWTDQNGNSDYDPLEFYVPVGTSRVLKLNPEDVVDAREFKLTDDAEEFDNSFYVVPLEQLELVIGYIGTDAPNDPEQALFYLESALVESPSRKPKVRRIEEEAGFQSGEYGLLVVNGKVSSELQKSLSSYLNDGGTVLFVLDDPGNVDEFETWTGASALATEPQLRKNRDDYVMLADIEFSDPFFRPFNQPRFNDFTKIRFWQHVAVELDEAEVDVIARFDNESPAIWRRKMGQGSVYGFAFGWQPSASQLALSSKFVPMVNGLLELGADVPQLTKSLLINQKIQFPAAGSRVSKREMIKPNGDLEILDLEDTSFGDTTIPGIYCLKETQRGETQSGQEKEYLFAVNLDRAESETELIQNDQLESLGIKLGEQSAASTELAQLRDLKDREIESQQKFWKWLILSAIILLVVETWLAGRTSAKQVASQDLEPEPV